jgi:iron complex transport system ATP-binding protein
MLSCNNIHASYRDMPVLSGVTFSIEKKSFTGIIGPNGAGKTTILKIITGVKKPQSGTVLLNNINITSMSRKGLASVMAVVPQSTFVPPLFTVEDVVEIGRYAHIKNRFTESDSDRKVIENAMERTGVLKFRNRFVSELSGGERQEVLIARALAQEPQLLILDEPTANLDIRHQIRILDLIKQLVSENNLTALMVIHDLNLAARYCNNLLLLHNKNVAASGDPASVLTSDSIAKTYDVNALTEFNAGVNAVQVTVLSCLKNEGLNV